jgi:hypothetical protein
MSWIIEVVQWCISCVDSNQAVAPTIGVAAAATAAPPASLGDDTACGSRRRRDARYSVLVLIGAAPARR